MKYVDYDEVPDDKVADVFDALTDAFTLTDADVAVALAAMCHKIAAIAAHFCSTEEEAGLLMANFANDALRRIPAYQERAAAGMALAYARPAGNA